MANEERPRREMTAREAGRLGGERTKERHGPDFYSEIGRKGQRRLKELLAKGRAAEDATTDTAREVNDGQ